MEDPKNQSVSSELLQRIRLVQRISIVWMSAEAAVALFAAWQASSPALLAFGGDSTIELLSALIVLWSFRPGAGGAKTERTAARFAAGLLLLLAGIVLATSIVALLGYREPRPSLAGTLILVVAAVLMPLLAHEKRRLSNAAGSAALRADAAESLLCGYLSLIALAGLLASRFFHLAWADPVAALAILPFLFHEAREAWKGRPCGCAAGTEN